MANVYLIVQYFRAVHLKTWTTSNQTVNQGVRSVVSEISDINTWSSLLLTADASPRGLGLYKKSKSCLSMKREWNKGLSYSEYNFSTFLTKNLAVYLAEFLPTFLFHSFRIFFNFSLNNNWVILKVLSQSLRYVCFCFV